VTHVTQPQANDPQGTAGRAGLANSAERTGHVHNTDDEPSGYGAALTELEGILRELDRDDVDVDVLGEQVRRAAQLLRFCRDRITSARFEVEHVVAELEDDDAEGTGTSTTQGTSTST
jgi:exodeoxyribonuclease VII small subunit